MNRPLLRVIPFSAFALVALAPGPASAQSSGEWERPAGFTPEPRRAEPVAQAMFGVIGFDEPEFQLSTPVDGLSVSTLGGRALPGTLSFSFTSADISISSGPGTTVFVDAPLIEGDAFGTLAIDFGVDVTRVAFGFAQNCAIPNTPSMMLTAKDAGGSAVGSTAVPGHDFGFFFLENQVDFSPTSPARTVEIAFDTSSGTCFRFALDNLAYDALMVPTMPPAAVAALLAALLLLAVRFLRRQSLT